MGLSRRLERKKGTEKKVRHITKHECQLLTVTKRKTSPCMGEITQVELQSDKGEADARNRLRG